MGLFTIGHGKTPFADIATVLKANGVEYLVDVRAAPFTNRNPEFNFYRLKVLCKESGLEYHHEGEALGGLWPRELVDERIERMKSDPNDRAAIILAALAIASDEYNVVLLCSESDHTKCHRYWWLSRYVETVLGRKVTHLHKA